MTGAGREGLKPGQVVELAVEKGVYRGLGLARHEGQVVFVPRTLPGDRLRVRVESVGAGFARARALERLEDGPGRRPSPCGAFPLCGGCAYQELDYAAQLELKGAIVAESLSRAGLDWPRPVPVEASPEEGWRVRATLHLQGGGPSAARLSPHGPGSGTARRSLRLGFHEEGTHRVVDVERCLHLSPAANRGARALLGALEAHPRLAGDVDAVELAESGDTTRLVAALHVATPLRTERLLGLADAAPGLSGLGLVSGPEARPRYVGLRGEPHVEHEVLSVGLRTHVLAFFQGNRFLTEALARHVGEVVGGGGRVLDLYAGCGLFCLTLASRSESALAVEGNPLAVEDGRFNAERAGTGVRFLAAEVGEALRSLPAGPGERVVLDPPRGGAGKDVVAAILARRPEVLAYVSCDPATLGRDLALFRAGGLAVDSLRAFDLFPDTFHVETVARLVPR